MRLLVVEDVFSITGRGVVLAPDVELKGPVTMQLRVELRRPDGTRLVLDALASVPFVDPPRANGRTGHVLLLPKLTRDDVPIGTEVWLVQDEHAA